MSRRSTNSAESDDERLLATARPRFSSFRYSRRRSSRCCANLSRRGAAEYRRDVSDAAGGGLAACAAGAALDRPICWSTSSISSSSCCNAFVGFTTSVFSASYIGHEIEIGRLTPTYLRFYHAMYQILMFAMNLALLANNIGLMWVAIEIATLTTVMMVGIYRTHEALEAAWKYFILGSVGIALALFGTILVYVAAQPVIGEGVDAMVWTELVQHAAGVRSGAAQCRLRLPAARLWHQGRAWRRSMPGCPTRMPKARRRSRRCCRACSSMSRSMRCCASRC